MTETGREGKRETRDYEEVEEDEWEWGPWQPGYYIRSTVLGGEVVTEVAADGSKARTFVRAAGAEIAWQNGSSSTGNVSFQHYDAAGSSYRTTHTGTYTGGSYEGGPAELDPMGTNVGNVNPYTQQSPGEYCVGCEQINTEMPHYMHGQPMTVTRDGMNINWTVFHSLTDGRMFDQLSFLRWQSITILPATRGRVGIVDDGEGGSSEGDWGTTSEPSYSSTWHFVPVIPIRPIQLRLEKTPCADLATTAQAVRDEFVNNWERVGNSWTVSDFDKAFTLKYLYKTATGDLKTNIYFYKTGATINGDTTFGQQDFKDKYLDSDFPRESTDRAADQVHHLVAYLSAGMNGAYWSSTAHKQTEGVIYRSVQSKALRGPNLGDMSLGDAAYELGEEIRQNPLLLKTIGDEIKKRFCR